MYDEKLKTKLKPKTVPPKTCTFYCRGIEIRNRKFALDEVKKLRFASIGKYIDALLEWRRLESSKQEGELYE
jgi:hypothetical protein